MHEITYYSIAKPGLDSNDVAEILKKAQGFNANNEITGCLLYYGHHFVQILEGEKTIIGQLLEKITKDQRHHHLYVIAEGEKEERTFGNWKMAYRELNDKEAQDINDSIFKDNMLSFAALASKPTYTIKSFWTRVQRLLTNDFTS